MLSAKRSISLLLFIIFTSLSATEFSLDGNFRGIFDNLENKFGEEESGTIFGTNSDISVGFMPDKKNSILAGVHLFQTFGDKEIGDFQPLISYKFDNQNELFLFGSAVRENFLEYHDYIISKRWQIENPVFEGVYFQQKIPNINLQWTVWVDWIGFQSKDTREMFLLGNDGDYFLKINEAQLFNFGWQFLYHHKASRDRDFFKDPVEDIGALAGKIRYEYKGFSNPKVNFFEATIRGLLTYDRQRQFSSDYYTTFGIEPSVKIDFKRVGLGYSHFLKIYEHSPFEYDLETGDNKFGESFGQADINGHFLDSEYAKIDFTLSFLFVEDGVNHRQTLEVTVPIKHKKEIKK